MKKLFLSILIIFLMAFSANAEIGTDGTIGKDPNSSTKQTITTPTISGGTIDSTIIGGTTPAAGTFTDLAGNVPIVTHGATENATAAQMKGQTHVVSGAYVVSLPTAVVGYRATFIASTAAAFSLDLVTGTDLIVLNGTALAAGNKATSDATIYSEIYVECRLAGKYSATAVKGVFVDGGA